MNLHSKIMNIPEPLCEGMARRDALLFKTGHRDARHVAAELANEADAINAELLEALKGLVRAAHYRSAAVAVGHDGKVEFAVEKFWAAMDSAQGAITKAEAQS
jgi:hypothetical protein